MQKNINFVILNNLHAIIRFYNEQPNIIYTASDTLHKNEALLAFINELIPVVQQQKHPVHEYFSLAHQVYQIHFIPEDISGQQHILVVIQLTERLEASLEDEQFIDHIRLFFHKGAHDMKNLLNNVQMLLGKNMIEKSQHYLTELKTHYLQQIDLFYKALDQLVKMETPAESAVKTLRFETMATQVEATFRPNNQHFTLETDFQQCPAIRYRQDYLSNMMTALFDNAIQYQTEDRQLIIKMSTRKTSGYVLFSIEDNGEGLDISRHKDKLFQPFQRFSKKSKGQGIGLHLVKVAVEKNGGKVNLESSLHHGTKVTLFLKEYL